MLVRSTFLLCLYVNSISGYIFKRNSGKRKWVVVQRRGKGVKDVAVRKAGKEERKESATCRKSEEGRIPGAKGDWPYEHGTVKTSTKRGGLCVSAL